MFYIADLYDVLNFLFNATIWILILFCVIKILGFIKRLVSTGTRNGIMGLLSFLKAKDIPLRVKIILLTIGGTFLFAIIKGLTANNL